MPNFNPTKDYNKKLRERFNALFPGEVITEDGLTRLRHKVRDKNPDEITREDIIRIFWRKLAVSRSDSRSDIPKLPDKIIRETITIVLDKHMKEASRFIWGHISEDEAYLELIRFSSDKRNTVAIATFRDTRDHYKNLTYIFFYLTKSSETISHSIDGVEFEPGLVEIEILLPYSDLMTVVRTFEFRVGVTFFLDWAGSIVKNLSQYERLVNLTEEDVVLMLLED